tara:strand:+ start:443 stop:1288 length:846 start_codon:yes stop_codon:yes gene_type:complete
MIKKILLIVFIFFSCSNESNNIESNPENISLFVITEDIVVGENRVLFTVLDKEGNNISQNLKFSLKKLNLEELITIEDYELINWPGNRTVFKTNINFDTVGYWEIISSYRNSKASGVIDVKEKSNTLSVGENISSIKTPSLREKEINELSTDINPNENLYKYSLDEALSKNIPIILSFSTPGLCVTATCAPQLSELKSLSNDYEEKIIIIHIEIWENFKEVMNSGDFSVGILNKSVEAFGITSEPWTFLINKEGIVKNRYQGYVDSKELREDLVKINAHDQ